MVARKRESFQIIDTKVHGMADYATGILLIVAPYLFGFADNTAAQWVPMILGAAVIGISLLTRYELGIYGIIPMPMHLMLDVIQALILVASPWLFGFSNKIILPHVIIGLCELAIVAMSRAQTTRGASARLA